MDSRTPLGDFYPLDTANKAPMYVLRTHDAAFLRVSERAKVTLEGWWAGLSSSEILETLDDARIEAVPADVEHYVAALYSRVAIANASRARMRGGYLVKATILPKHIVGVIAGFLQLAFTPLVAMISCALMALALLSWYAQAWTIGALRVNVETAAVAYSLFLLSAFVHEFGHAAACFKFGVRPGPIGFTLYWTFPALFTDTAETWRLARMQRVVVDVGGSYLQLIVGSIYTLLYFLTHQQVWDVAVLMIVGTTIFNLNPIFKFDGYWLVSDALGIPNLIAEVGKLARSLVDSEYRAHYLAILPRSGLTMLLTILYSAISVGVWAVFVWKLAVYTTKGLSVAIVGFLSALYTHKVPNMHDLGDSVLPAVGTTVGILVLSRLLVAAAALCRDAARRAQRPTA